MAKGKYEHSYHGDVAEIKAAVVTRVVEAIKAKTPDGDALKRIEAELNAEYDAAIAAFYKASDAECAFRELFW